MRRSAVAVLVLGCVAMGVACADLFGIQNGVLEDGGALDASLDAIEDVPYDHALPDAIDLDVNTASCDGGIAPVDPVNAMWVSGNVGHDATGCGSQGMPCRTINYALANNSVGLTTFCLDNAVFQESLVLVGGGANYTFQGGWVIDAGVWTEQCSTSLTTIQGPIDGGSSTVDLVGPGGPDSVTFRLLTIKSKVGGTSWGESVYAMRVIETKNVLLDNVTLLAQTAADGLGGTGASPTMGCSTTAGGSGVSGTQGPPGSAGQWSSSGYTPQTASTGGAGQTGSVNQGQPGACGPYGTCQ